MLDTSTASISHTVSARNLNAVFANPATSVFAEDPNAVSAGVSNIAIDAPLGTATGTAADEEWTPDPNGRLFLAPNYGFPPVPRTVVL